VIWFTSDWHLGHDNIIRYCNRPWRSVYEMNSVLLANANAVLRPSDTLYVMGDFALQRDTFESYAASLRMFCGAVYFLRGNHDAKQAKIDGLAMEFKHNKRHYYLCHYPWQQWRPNTVMLHGHCHDNPIPLPSDPRQHMRFDVGVDTEWNGRRYYPVSIEQIEERINGC